MKRIFLSLLLSFSISGLFAQVNYDIRTGGQGSTKGNGATFENPHGDAVHTGSAGNHDGGSDTGPGGNTGNLSEGGGKGKGKGKGKLADPLRTFMETITARELRAHNYLLSSDEFEGRETAARGQKVTARYLASQFMLYGLKPGAKEEAGLGYYQTFKLERVNVKNVELSLTGKDRYQLYEDFVFFNKASMDEDITVPLTYAGYGISDSKYDNYAGLDVKGKAVVCLSGEPMDGGKSMVTGETGYSEWSTDWGKKRKLAQEKGASALIIILPADIFQGLSGNPMVRHMIGDPGLSLAGESSDAIPMVFISPDMAETFLKKNKRSVKEEQEQLGKSAKVTPMNFSKFEFSILSDIEYEAAYAENVLGFLEGTDLKDEVVVITAHYDHLGIKGEEVYNGADDDGSGTSAVLEIAQAFSIAAQEGYRPRRSILFMPVSGEEKGLLGSEYYVEHPTIPLSKIVTNLNIDMIGRVDPEHEEKGEKNYVYIIGSDKLSTDLHKVNEHANRHYGKLKLDYTYNEPDDPNRFYYRSDHYNFAKNNIPVIFYFTGVHADYHKSTDTFEKIDFNKMETITRLVFATAWEVANRDERLAIDKENDFPSDR